MADLAYSTSSSAILDSIDGYLEAIKENSEVSTEALKHLATVLGLETGMPFELDDI